MSLGEEGREEVSLVYFSSTSPPCYSRSTPSPLPRGNCRLRRSFKVYSRLTGLSNNNIFLLTRSQVYQLILSPSQLGCECKTWLENAAHEPWEFNNANAGEFLKNDIVGRKKLNHVARPSTSLLFRVSRAMISDQ